MELESPDRVLVLELPGYETRKKNLEEVRKLFQSVKVNHEITPKEIEKYKGELWWST